jgi:hypothetical protein
VRFAEEVPSCWMRHHDIKTRSWTKKIDTGRPDCIFNEHQKFVRSQFGIDVWITNVRLPELRFEDADLPYESWKQYEAHETTMAYLTLPNKVTSRKDWSSVENYLGDFESGYAMPVKLGAAPTQASLRRFPRTMNLLGLELFVHPVQKETVIVAPTDVPSSDVDDGVDGLSADWPQLTLLTRSRNKEQ